MPTIGKHKKKVRKGPEVAKRLPPVFPQNKCRLRLLKLNRISDWLLLEEEFIKRSLINVNHETEKDIKLKEKDEETQELLSALRGLSIRVDCLLI